MFTMKNPYAILLITLVLLTVGCVPKWRNIGTEEVRKKSKRVGIISTETHIYHAPRAITFPSETDGELVLKFDKLMKSTVEYNTPIYKQKVLSRKISIAEVGRENIIKEITEGSSIPLKIIALIGLPINILLSPLCDHFEGEPETQINRVEIPNSDSVEVFYDIEYNSTPANGIEIDLSGIGKTITTNEGYASFKVDPELFNQGVVLENKADMKKYLIKREKHTKTYNYVAPWRDAAQLASNVQTVYLTFKGVKNVIAIGGGPYAIAGTVIVEVATGLFVGFIIDVLATSERTDEFYRWKIQHIN